MLFRSVATLMKRMGIQALYRKPNTSKRHPAHPVFAYALRGLAIEPGAPMLPACSLRATAAHGPKKVDGSTRRSEGKR